MKAIIHVQYMYVAMQSAGQHERANFLSPSCNIVDAKQITF